MAFKTKKTDPLSRFFQDLNEEQLSSSEEDEKSKEDCSYSNVEKEACEISRENQKKLSSNIFKPAIDQVKSHSISKQNEEVLKDSKLPSANECLSSYNKPTFLQVLDKQNLNWDVLEKRLTDGDATISSEIDNYKTNSVPPPASYEPVTDPGIKVADKKGRKRKIEDEPTKAYTVMRDDDDSD